MCKKKYKISQKSTTVCISMSSKFNLGERFLIGVFNVKGFNPFSPRPKILFLYNFHLSASQSLLLASNVYVLDVLLFSVTRAI